MRFLLITLCLFCVAAVNADELKPLRQITDNTPKDDFASALSGALNSPLNGPPVYIPKRVPPPVPDIIRGQSPPSGAADVLSERPPHPQGSVNMEALDPKLLDSEESRMKSEELTENEKPKTQDNAAEKQSSPPSLSSDSSQWANAVLLVITIVSVMMLVYAVVIAYDYRQRWMQTLLAQNNHFAMDSGDYSDTF
ncbi:MAG: hypothetical protein LBN39_03565 [Planctomycetaceae bacterium]|jgi:hypothetical protein|nr:hypothetical protein [Planctomycetaceae bacterium]